MITFATVQASLHNSNWPAEAKQAGINIASKLGRETLSYLDDAVHETGSYLSADEIIDILGKVPAWYAAIENGSQDSLVNEISELVYKNDEQALKPLLAIILDVRDNSPLNAKLTPELSELFDRIELQYFNRLPQQEVVEMLAGRLEQVVPMADIHQELKRYCYYHDLNEPTDPRIIAYRKALENSSAEVGGKKIGDWLHDFVESRVGNKDRTTYNVAFYITNDPKVLKLSAPERQVITEILQLYNWLFNPFVTEDEVEGYEAHRIIGEHEADTAEVPEQPSEPVAEISAEQTQAVQKKIIQDIASHSKQGIRYNNEGANIRDLVNRKKTEARGGLVLERETNIVIDDESKRLEETRNHSSDIQNKLEELRKRNNA